MFDRYNVRQRGGSSSDTLTPAPWSSNMPMEQRFQFGPPPTPPAASNPQDNHVTQNPNITFGPPVGGGAAAGPDGVSRLTAPFTVSGDGAQTLAARKIAANQNRNSTLGLSFHNRLEKIRFITGLGRRVGKGDGVGSEGNYVGTMTAWLSFSPYRSVPVNAEQLKNRLETQIWGRQSCDPSLVETSDFSDLFCTACVNNNT